MIYDEFLDFNVDDTPFLFYKNGFISRKEFVSEITLLAKNLPKDIDTNSFIYINIENPIKFYVAIFALWKHNLKVIFPTKQSLENNQVPEYAKYIFSFQKEWELSNNPSFPLNILIGDTVVFSSGSTGKPKGIIHKKDHFFMNAKETLRLLDIKQATSICYLKPYLVSAISHTLVHWYSKSTLIFDHFDNIHHISKYKTLSKNLNVVGSPIHIITAYQYLKKFHYSPQFFFSSGDMISSTHIETILNNFPNAIFFKVYGLAEIAGRLFIKKITLNGITDDIGVSLPSAHVTIVNNEIVVKSDMLFSGYIIGNKYIPQCTHFYTGDIVNCTAEDYCILEGRKNDEIKVAGNKIAVKYLENIISSVLKDFHIDFLTVIPVPHDFFGNTLSLILSINTNLSKKDLILSLRTKLESYQVPHAYYIINLEDIPFTQTMKIDRKKLQKMIINSELRNLS